jgi:hypothetical protein
MKRFQVLLFVLGAVGVALVAMLVAGILIGTDPHTEKPSGLVSPGRVDSASSRDEPVAWTARPGVHALTVSSTSRRNP